MKVTVFGATGVVGRALLPLLVSDHELVAVSRSTHATGQGVRWVEGDAGSAAHMHNVEPTPGFARNVDRTADRFDLGGDRS